MTVFNGYNFVIFPENTISHLNYESIKMICMRTEITGLVFKGYQDENFMEFLQEKTGLIICELQTCTSTYEEIMNFIEGNLNTLRDLRLYLAYPDVTMNQLADILMLAKKIDNYIIYIETTLSENCTEISKEDIDMAKNGA